MYINDHPDEKQCSVYLKCHVTMLSTIFVKHAMKCKEFIQNNHDKTIKTSILIFYTKVFSTNFVK